MYQYTAFQWIFFFLLYSFLGWCYESTYVSIRKRHLVNRGFVRGPFLPLYGSGAIMMLVVSAPFQNSIILTYLAGCAGATALEYVTGVLMENLFQVRYWDYSKMKFNFQGHICLAATLLWGVFTVVMTNWVHAPIERLVMQIPADVLMIVTNIICVVELVDFTLSFKTALDLRDVLVKMDRVKEELLKLQRRLEVVTTFIGSEKEQPAFTMNERFDSITAAIEERFGKLREMLPKMELSEEVRREISDLRVKFSVHKERRFQLSNMKDFYRKAMILGNPTMVSVKFKEAFEELKNSAEKKADK